MPMTLASQTDLVASPTLTPGELNFYRAEGYLRIPALLPPESVETIRRDNRRAVGAPLFISSPQPPPAPARA